MRTELAPVLVVAALAASFVAIASAVASDADDDVTAKPIGPPVKLKATSQVEITPYPQRMFVAHRINRSYDFIDPFDGQPGLLLRTEVDARTAAEWGLINQAVPAEELRAASRRLAEKVAEASPLTLAIGKQAFYAQVDLDQPKAYAYAKEVMSMNALSADAQEGIGAFLGKRRPCWTCSIR